MVRPLALALAFVSAFSQTVLAQAEPRVVDRRAHSIVVGVGSDTSLGYWLRIAPQTDLGFEIGARVVDDDETYARSIAVRSGIKRYLMSSESDVAPYVLVGATAAWARFDSGGSLELSSRELGGFIAMGVDWFPVRRVSLGGHLGVEALVTSRERSAISPLPDENLSGYNVGTFSSGIRGHFFF